jgi:uncharacterized protein (DUF58 family)
VRRAAATALLGCACALGAAAFGTPSLYVPGIGLLALGLGAAAWVALAARGAEIRRSLGGRTVEEGQRLPVSLSARTGLLPAPGGELADPLVDGPVPLGGRRSRRVRVEVAFRHRGRRRVAPSRLVIRDPLSLARRELTSAPAEILVLPRIEPLRAGPAGGAGLAAAGHHGDADAMAELELDSLRPYRPGTPASRIHWPTVARTGTMVERRLVPDADARPLVVLDPRGAPTREALDAAVRAAGSLTLHLARQGGCALLLPGERRPIEVGPDLRPWPALHVRLALVEPEAGAPVLSRAERAGAVFWVTPSAAGPAAGRLTTGARYVVTPAGRAGAPAFSVGGCAGYRVGSGRARAA